MFLHVTPISERIAFAFDLVDGPVLIPREPLPLDVGQPMWTWPSRRTRRAAEEPPQQ